MSKEDTTQKDVTKDVPNGKDVASLKWMSNLVSCSSGGLWEGGHTARYLIAETLYNSLMLRTCDAATFGEACKELGLPGPREKATITFDARLLKDLATGMLRDGSPVRDERPTYKALLDKAEALLEVGKAVGVRTSAVGTSLLVADLSALDKATPQIDPDDLYIHPSLRKGNALETDRHLTLLFGMKEGLSPTLTKAITSLVRPFWVKAAKLGAFLTRGKTFDDGTVHSYDILHVVLEESKHQELTHIRELAMRDTNTVPEYPFKPHLTLAYLKAGRAQKYIDGYEEGSSSTLVTELEVRPYGRDGSVKIVLGKGEGEEIKGKKRMLERAE